MISLLFDCDGVLSDTEREGHLPAFNQTFREFGLPVQWSEAEYGVRLRIGGGKERMASLLTDEFVAAAGLPPRREAQLAEVARWHKRKTSIYTAMADAGRLPPRPGIRRIVQEALDRGWTLAMASTSAPASVDAILRAAVGESNAARFAGIFAGDMVPHKKPAPDIYNLALERLSLDPAQTLAIEDSNNGLQAATAAGLRCLVTLSSYTHDEDMTSAALVVSDLGDPGSDIEILANRSAATPSGWISLDDMVACLE